MEGWRATKDLGWFMEMGTEGSEVQNLTWALRVCNYVQ